MSSKTVGILTGGGDCPGLNAVIRGAVRKGIALHEFRFRGIMQGWKGMMECLWQPLGQEEVSGILPKGGTILGTSRTNPFKDPDGADIVVENMKRMKLDALIVIGGDDTLTVAHKLAEMGTPVVGVPKTIDNDINNTDYTFGFDTAVNIVTEALDRIHTTAESHNRVMVVEVMGRNSGYIAVQAGIATGAEMIITPERPMELNQVFREMEEVGRRGKRHFIIVVAEGAPWGAAELSEMINAAENPYEARYTVLGYTQRGGSPTALDRILATRMGVVAVDALWEGRSGVLVAWQASRIVVLDADSLAPRLDPWDEQVDRVHRITST